MIFLHLAFFGLVLLSLKALPTLAPNPRWLTKATEHAVGNSDLPQLPESLTLYSTDGHDYHNVDQHEYPYHTGYGEPANLHNYEQYLYQAPAELQHYSDGRGIEAGALPAYQHTHVPDHNWARQQGHVYPQEHAYPQMQPIDAGYDRFISPQPYGQAQWSGAGHPHHGSLTRLVNSAPDLVPYPAWIDEAAGPSESHTGDQPRLSFPSNRIGPTSTAKKGVAHAPEATRQGAFPPAFVGYLMPWNDLLGLSEISLNAHKDELLKDAERLLSTTASWTELEPVQARKTWHQMVPTVHLEAWLFKVLRFRNLQQLRLLESMGHLPDPLRSLMNSDLKVPPLPTLTQASVEHLRKAFDPVSKNPNSLRAFLESPPHTFGALGGGFAVNTFYFYIWRNHGTKGLRALDEKVFNVAAVDTTEGRYGLKRFCIFNGAVIDYSQAGPLFSGTIDGRQQIRGRAIV